MESINFLMIFDIVILGYGFLIVRGALQMHKTNVPASMLIPAEELTGCKDPVGFVRRCIKRLWYLESFVLSMERSARSMSMVLAPLNY